MSDKPTDEELEQRIKRTEKIGNESLYEATIRNQISEIFLTVSDELMYEKVLKVILKTTKSKYGVFGYINDDGDLVCPSMTGEIWNKCQMSEKDIVFPCNEWRGMWGQALKEKKILYSNKPFNPPEGHVAVNRAMFAPIIYQDESIGFLSVANKKANYTEEDKKLFKQINDHIAPVLNARLKIDRLDRNRKQAEQSLQKAYEKVEQLVEDRTKELKKTNELLLQEIEERKQAEESLHRIEWLLTKPITPHPARDKYASPYGDLTELNTCRLLLNSVGKDVLQDIVGDYLELLDTSAAVYEKNGDYALGIFSSGWCRFLDNASRNLCKTDDNKKALESGNWICHESCWTKASKVAIETGQKIDIECHGGINLYAVPILAGKQIIGAINFGYGDPPGNAEKLQEIADRYDVTKYELLKHADSYESRPQFIIEVAKNRLLTSARLIGEIIERKQAEEERKKLEARLRHAQKLEAIGTLAGGIAHDFNNLLMAIQGNASLALLKVDHTHPNYEFLETINNLVESGAELTGQLLDYARKGKHYVLPVNLNLLVKQTAITFGRTRKDILIKQELSEDLFDIEVDSNQIQQVLFNLLVNAADAMPGGGQIILKTATVTDKDMKGRLYDTKPGNYVSLMITDTGKGMDKEIMDRIFDPFFTTKEIGKGAGLGLASAYGSIKGYGGYIDVDSVQGVGTTFTVYLPATKKKLDKPVKLVEEEVAVRGTETILIVDDEERVVNVGIKLLKELGYTVIEARNGNEAIEVYRANKNKIDLVILDMVMPHMGGGEAYNKIKEINPNIKVLLSSGYSMGSETKEIMACGCNGFIQKPFKLNKLSQKIRKILDKK